MTGGAALLALWALGSAAPQDADERCLATGDAAAGITVAIMDCLGSGIDREDARLNAAWRALSPTTRTRLRAAQRDWIARRDADCRREADAEGGGSLAGILYNGCILERTKGRAEWLEARRAG